MEHDHHDQECHRGHHPMKLLLPLLVLPVAIGMARKFAHHRMGMHMRHHPEWQNGVPPFFAEMHRRAHAAEAAGEVHEA
jgi:hypothetical protein